MNQAVTTLNLGVPKPQHIPESALHGFDMFSDSAYQADAHERGLHLVRTAPNRPARLHCAHAVGLNSLPIVWEV
jgi:hypothetical protein